LTHWPASTVNRCHLRWLTAAALALVGFAALVAAGPARGNTTLGQIAPETPSADCSETVDYLQPSITSGNLYIARQAGTITSWSTLSEGAGATYVFKIFRRTSDPDIFQVIAHAAPHVLSAGMNTVPVNIAVRAGDMIGINESGPDNSCTFPWFGDQVLTRSGSVSDGASGQFSPLGDVRLNLSAVLVPSNDFTIASITRDPKLGTAVIMVDVSNPGILALSGKGMKKRNNKTVAVAGTVPFKIASVGAKKRKLRKRGKVSLTPSVTFFPTNGDPATKPFVIKLKLKIKKRPPAPPTGLGHPNAH
jgi:hypothetical protein